MIAIAIAGWAFGDASTRQAVTAQLNDLVGRDGAEAIGAMLAGAANARLISLLPPVHIAIIPATCLLSSLDELYTLIPKPADRTSSMVFITGPSRTADIEQILVRGVHGPGEIHVVIIDR